MKRFRFWKRPEDEGLDGGGARDPAGESRWLLSGETDADQESLRILLESIAEVSSSMELQSVLRDIVDKSLTVSSAERGVLLLGGGYDDLEIRVARDASANDLGTDLQFSSSVVRKALEEGSAVRSVVQSDQQALELGQSVFDLKLRAVMCAPLQAKEAVLGVIYVDSRAARREFSDRDLALFGALSAQLAIAVYNAQLHEDSLAKARLEKDFEIAHRIQQHLLSAVPEHLTSLDVAVRFKAAEHASGDSYDFIPLSNDRLAVVIGDVTGHGVGAALLTHAAQAALRSYLELSDDLGDVVARLNNRLVAGVETGNFMSLVLAVIDPVAKTLHYVNAGHQDLIVLREDRVDRLAKTGMVLGVVADTEYGVEGPIDLEPNDVLFLRTDGIDETADSSREVFGEERLTKVLVESRTQGADAILTAVDSALERHSSGGPAEDDMTMVAVRLLGGA